MPKLRRAVEVLPEVSPEVKAELLRILRTCFLKPMKGRWGSFLPVQKKIIDLIKAGLPESPDGKVLAIIIHNALDSSSPWRKKQGMRRL